MTHLPPFKLENFLNQWEFKTRYLLCCSDVESIKMKDLLAFADTEDQVLWDNLSLAYTEPKGHPLLLQEIAKLYGAQGEDKQGSRISPYAHLHAQNILTFAGAEEAIFCTLKTLIKPGDHVITLSPNYESLEKLPKHFGAEVSLLSLQEENQWRLDKDQLKNMITPKTTMIILNYPHNPTGSHLSLAEMMEIVEIARSYGLYLFNDEVYRLMEHDPAGLLPPVACLYEKGISVSVMTKAYGLAGLRIGWVVLQDTATLQSIMNTKFYASICNSAPSEILALIALKNERSILSGARALIQQNMRLLDDFINHHEGLLRWVKPTASCVGLVHLDPSLMTTEELSSRALEQEGVLIMPARLMGGDAAHFRMGYGRANFAEALNRFGRVIQRLQS